MQYATLLYKLIACHMLGDYVLQTDFLANTKGQNWWHLIAHCVLYTLPFAMAFGIDYNILLLFVSHIIIDALKARWQKIDYTQDQVAHIIIMVLLYIV